MTDTDRAREIAIEVLDEYMDGKILRSPNADILAIALVRIIGALAGA